MGSTRAPKVSKPLSSERYREQYARLQELREKIIVETLADWRRIGGGDGFQCAVDPKDPDTVYYETQYGNPNRVDLKAPAKQPQPAKAPTPPPAREPAKA